MEERSDLASAWVRFVAGDWLWIAAVALLLALVTRVRRPEDRSSLANTMGLGLVSLAGLWIAAILEVRGAQAATAVRAGFIVLGGLVGIRIAGQFVFRIAAPALRITPPRILEDLIVIAGYVVWSIACLRLAGVDISGIVATSAVVTAIVAFSMQDTLGNILGGVALELDSEFEIGDWIRVDDVVGRVVDIRWRSVSLETRNWERAVIPNSLMVKSKVIVYGRRHDGLLKLRRIVGFAVALAATPARVIATIEEALAAANIPNVASDPRPSCIVMEFDRGFARYALRYWLTNLAADDATDSAVREHIVAALQRADMRLAVPEQSVHVVAEDAAHAERIIARELGRRQRSLRSVELFAELTDGEIHTLAELLVPAPFAQDDVITHQGAIAHWLYILVSGRVEVLFEQTGKPTTRIAVLEGPTVFGEMGLLTGEPRRATVIARTAVECYRLDKHALQRILERRPELAERMSQVAAQRQTELDLGKSVATTTGTQAGQIGISEEILQAIRGFFGLKSN